MRLIKFTHSCVRLELDGRVLVMDPGIWSEPRALDGADAVLITHEHVDHVDVLRLRGAGVPVFAPSLARLPGLHATAVSAGDAFTAAGLASIHRPAWRSHVVDLGRVISACGRG